MKVSKVNCFQNWLITFQDQQHHYNKKHGLEKKPVEKVNANPSW